MISLTELLKYIWRIQEEEGVNFTLLGIGPMSINVVRTSLELAQDEDFPLFFIASRNQVDSRELGGGYIRGWDQKSFRKTVEELAGEVGFKGLLYLCRDHGGPWQRDEEKKAKLPEKEAMNLAQKSYLADLEAEFHLLHIDPTKDPHMHPSPVEAVVRRTVELIKFVEEMRRKRGMNTPLDYEVGTEDITGGLTESGAFEEYLKTLTRRLKELNLPQPVFVVGQTGTLVRMRENVGKFNPEKARELTFIARKYGMGFKEHNVDYLEGKYLLLHPDLGITAANVAPEFGVVETESYLKLARIEEERVKGEKSHFIPVIQRAVLESGRWKKWLKEEESHLSREDVARDEEKLAQITRVSGHYVFDVKEVERAREKLFHNLKKEGIIADPLKVVRREIRSSLKKYVDAFNLRGLTSKVLRRR